MNDERIGVLTLARTFLLEGEKGVAFVSSAAKYTGLLVSLAGLCCNSQERAPLAVLGPVF